MTVERGYRRAAVLLALFVTGVTAVCAAGVALGMLYIALPVSEHPAAYAALDAQKSLVVTVISDAQELVAEATGKSTGDDTGPVSGSAAAGVYGSTFLAVDDPTVVALTGVVAGCQATVEKAETYQDPALTLVARVPRRDASPVVVTMSDVDEVTLALTGCVTSVDPSAVATAWEKARDTSALATATEDNTTARASLQAAVTAAQTVLVGSAGKVSDQSVRDTLSAAISTAQAVLDTPVSSDGWKSVDGDTAAVQAQVEPLNAASSAVTAAQVAWQAAQEEAARSRYTPPVYYPSSGGGGSSSSSSGGGSYTGGGSTSGGGSTRPGPNQCAFGVCIDSTSPDTGRPQQTG